MHHCAYAALPKSRVSGRLINFPGTRIACLCACCDVVNSAPHEAKRIANSLTLASYTAYVVVKSGFLGSTRKKKRENGRRGRSVKTRGSSAKVGSTNDRFPDRDVWSLYQRHPARPRAYAPTYALVRPMDRQHFSFRAWSAMAAAAYGLASARRVVSAVVRSRSY
ncbi:hypothetical protein MRX96_051876 [Rhipicephalus microplus]